MCPPLDNAVIESWHSTLESRLLRAGHCATKAAARTGVAAWIEDHNHHRRHSSLGRVSPVDYERSLAGKEPRVTAGRPLYEWLSNGTYGVNHKGSLVYMGAMYLLAIVIYGGARIIRNRQGIDLSLINKEIPVE